MSTCFLHNARITIAAVFVCSAGLAIAAPADDTPPVEEPADEPAREAESDDEPSSLDDLLGLDEEEQDDSGEQAAQQDAEQDLRQRLTGEEIANAFQDALQKMSLSAELLDTNFDPGVGTQRLQEDVLARLQQLIDEAPRQPSSSSSSQSQSQSQSQQRQQQQQSDPGRQQQQQQDQSQQQDSRDGESREGDGPPLQEGDINTMLEETRSEWGALPQRVREMLLQGRQERFSSLYEQLTREYYRRLAEE